MIKNANRTQLDKAIEKANAAIEMWTVEELKQFAFDRLVTEYLGDQLDQVATQYDDYGYDANGSLVPYKNDYEKY